MSTAPGFRPPRAPRHPPEATAGGDAADSPAAAALIAGFAAESTDGAASSKPSPSPSYSGPGWEAYEAGRDFGKKHQGTARLPAEDLQDANGLAEEADEYYNGQGDDSTEDLQDAMRADMANADTWCARNLPENLETRHADQHDALMGGCRGGVLPMFDNPGMYAEEAP